MKKLQQILDQLCMSQSQLEDTCQSSISRYIEDGYSHTAACLRAARDLRLNYCRDLNGVLRIGTPWSSYAERKRLVCAYRRTLKTMGRVVSLYPQCTEYKIEGGRYIFK